MQANRAQIAISRIALPEPPWNQRSQIQRSIGIIHPSAKSNSRRINHPAPPKDALTNPERYANRKAFRKQSGANTHVPHTKTATAENRKGNSTTTRPLIDTEAQIALRIIEKWILPARLAKKQPTSNPAHQQNARIIVPSLRFWNTTNGVFFRRIIPYPPNRHNRIHWSKTTQKHMAQEQIVSVITLHEYYTPKIQ